MTTAVKICGLTTPAAIAAATRAGARFVGFVFYPPSPRALGPDEALSLAARVGSGVVKVGVFVDPDDELIARAAPALDMIQLHGAEPAARVAEIRSRTGLAVMKALPIAVAADLARAADYAAIADRLMFDAKPPAGVSGSLPGGNARAFDWRILAQGRARRATQGRPWMLSGGLTPENVAQAIAISGAEAVDVSSGVEDKPGVKNPSRIEAFIAAVRAAPYARPAAEEGEAG